MLGIFTKWIKPTDRRLESNATSSPDLPKNYQLIATGYLLGNEFYRRRVLDATARAWSDSFGVARASISPDAEPCLSADDVSLEI